MIRAAVKKAISVASVFAALCVPAIGQAATFSNAASGEICSFGSPDTTSYGQTFQLSANQNLANWTFYPTRGTAGNVKFVVARWNGVRAVGPALYSVDHAYPGGAAPMSFPAINLNLDAGSYIAYITVAGASGPARGVCVAGSAADGGLSGDFRFLNSDGVDPLTLNSSWASWSPAHMQFTANLEAAAPKTLAENIACAQNLIDQLAPNQVMGPAQKTMMRSLLNNVVAYRTQYPSLALGMVNAALVRTDGCALRNAPDTVINQGATGMDYVTQCAAQAPIYACLKDAQTQLSTP